MGYRWTRRMKRLIDIFVAAAILLFLSPLIIALGFAVITALGAPMLFRQQRPGKNGKLFEMIKFRTMRDALDQSGALLPDVDRLTGFGKWLRSTSLDELPGLWNVLKGDMSLVGPRPLLIEYLPLYSDEQARRHDIRPGLTGWAQVNGRNELSWEEKFELDTWYVDNQSLWLDFRILLLTVLKVLMRHGVTADNEATMPRFVGSKKS
jgi:lipopolysaccharide/colanic/teichoic acid biosynthesis glycosyltransferase